MSHGATWCDLIGARTRGWMLILAFEAGMPEERMPLRLPACYARRLQARPPSVIREQASALAIRRVPQSDMRPYFFRHQALINGQVPAQLDDAGHPAASLRSPTCCCA